MATADTWGGPQALAGGIETFDISALAAAKYVRFKIVLNSAGGIVSPTVDYCQIFPA